jgi:proteasome lid subunit RPN8/RPN11
VPADNVLGSPSRYRIDPQRHIASLRGLRGTERSVVGAYHSHPRSAPRPSPRDVAEAHYPEFVWLIVSLQSGEPEFAAFRIVSGTVTELTLALCP